MIKNQGLRNKVGATNSCQCLSTGFRPRRLQSGMSLLEIIIVIVLILLAFNACASDPFGGKLMELRQLPESERVIAFSRLEEGEKVELFFQANRRHPPYSGLNDAFEEEGKDFLARLRSELDVRGGVPEVLSFMVIASDLKRRGELSSDDMKDLRINSICQLAKQSQYCPELEAKLLTP